MPLCALAYNVEIFSSASCKTILISNVSSLSLCFNIVLTAFTEQFLNNITQLWGLEVYWFLVFTFLLLRLNEEVGFCDLIWQSLIDLLSEFLWETMKYIRWSIESWLVVACMYIDGMFIHLLTISLLVGPTRKYQIRNLPDSITMDKFVV